MNKATYTNLSNKELQQLINLDRALKERPTNNTFGMSAVYLYMINVWVDLLGVLHPECNLK